MDGLSLHQLHAEIQRLRDGFARRDQTIGPPGILLINPPYGERIGDEKDLVLLYRTLGKIFRTRCPGWTLFVFSGKPLLARQIGIQPTNVIDLFNGKIPCQLLEYHP